MEYSDLLKFLGKQIGGELQPDADGMCMIEVGDLPLTIQGFDELQMVALLGEIGEPPPERLEQLYATLLNANYLFQGTFGATLARNPNTSAIAMCKYLPYQALDGVKFVAEIEHFIATMQDWRQTVSEFRAEVAAHPSVPRYSSTTSSPTMTSSSSTSDYSPPSLDIDPEMPGFDLGMNRNFIRV